MSLGCPPRALITSWERRVPSENEEELFHSHPGVGIVVTVATQGRGLAPSGCLWSKDKGLGEEAAVTRRGLKARELPVLCRSRDTGPQPLVITEGVSTSLGFNPAEVSQALYKEGNGEQAIFFAARQCTLIFRSQERPLPGGSQAHLRNAQRCESWKGCRWWTRSSDLAQAWPLLPLLPQWTYVHSWKGDCAQLSCLESCPLPAGWPIPPLLKSQLLTCQSSLQPSHVNTASRGSFHHLHTQHFATAQWVKNLPANAEDMGSIPGSGWSPGGRHGNPLQYACLENPMDWGAWWVIVQRIAKIWTQLSEYGCMAYLFTIIVYPCILSSVSQSQWTEAGKMVPCCLFSLFYL